MTRLPDWRGRLARYIVGHAHTPLNYGLHDCALFAAGAVEAITGHDPARAFRGYKTRREGMERIKAAGMRSPFEFAASQLSEIHPARARDGDIAVVKDRQRCFGVFYGDKIAVLRADGLGWVPRLDAEQGFAV